MISNPHSSFKYKKPQASACGGTGSDGKYADNSFGRLLNCGHKLIQSKSSVNHCFGIAYSSRKDCCITSEAHTYPVTVSTASGRAAFHFQAYEVIS
ncbi:hypothetical protein [Marinicrinis lubricantis]|uniref:Uncharacterized protein n=1 Tax=Marinicrinis lubricantis TaxID=2086470 RepID=A0ABW1IMN2_9BACL